MTGHGRHRGAAKLWRNKSPKLYKPAVSIGAQDDSPASPDREGRRPCSSRAGLGQPSGLQKSGKRSLECWNALAFAPSFGKQLAFGLALHGGPQIEDSKLKDLPSFLRDGPVRKAWTLSSAPMNCAGGFFSAGPTCFCPSASAQPYVPTNPASQA